MTYLSGGKRIPLFWKILGLILIFPAIFVVYSCGGSSGGTGGFSLQLGAETTVLTSTQMQALGFQYGPPDGSLGVWYSGGNYTFLASANSAGTGPCSGTAINTQGTFKLGGNLGQLTSSGCTPLIQSGTDPNGYTFARDYAGGGPVLSVTSTGGQAGILHLYHGEYHSGSCGSGPCFYASLGMAISTNGGTSFSELGEVIQPYPTRAQILGASKNLDLGGGTLVIADDQGNAIGNLSTFDPSRVYLYLFYADSDSSNTTAPCNQYTCLAMARAPYSTVLSNAFAGTTSAFPTLFHKYYQGSFSQPGTSGDPTEGTNSGHYSPIITDVGSFPSVIYDSTVGQFLIAYTTGNNQIVVRSGTNLLSWSAPISAAAVSQSGYTIIYPTLVGEGSDPTTGGSNPVLFYLKASNWPTWSSASFVKRTLTLIPQ